MAKLQHYVIGVFSPLVIGCFELLVGVKVAALIGCPAGGDDYGCSDFSSNGGWFEITRKMENAAGRGNEADDVLMGMEGFYETRIAYYSWRGAAGYRFAAIPDY
ncbi:hypothetical protein RDABS01_019052 [Bienertia sinuspersici]